MFNSKWTKLGNYVVVSHRGQIRVNNCRINYEHYDNLKIENADGELIAVFNNISLDYFYNADLLKMNDLPRS